MEIDNGNNTNIIVISVRNLSLMIFIIEWLLLPLAEEDIIRNTDYIAFDKKSPETALALARGFRKEIASLGE